MALWPADKYSKKMTTKLTEALVLARTRAPDLDSVRKLNCWASQIEDASIVRKMQNLEVCSLSVNHLRSLEDFAHCPGLQELYVRKNHIENLSDIHFLRCLPNLRSLWLADNPCSQVDNYRMTVLRVLPKLQKLDNTVVTEEEVDRAFTEGDDLPLPEGFEPADFPPTATIINSGSTTTSNTSVWTASVDVPPFHAASNNTSFDLLSDDAEYKDDEEEDSGVDVSASRSHLRARGSSSSTGSGALHREGDRPLHKDPVRLSVEETNQIRGKLGLKPLPSSETSPRLSQGVSSSRNANILQSVLLLIRELDKDSLETVQSAVQQRLQDM